MVCRLGEHGPNTTYSRLRMLHHHHFQIIYLSNILDCSHFATLAEDLEDKKGLLEVDLGSGIISILTISILQR